MRAYRRMREGCPEMFHALVEAARAGRHYFEKGGARWPISPSQRLALLQMSTDAKDVN